MIEKAAGTEEVQSDLTGAERTRMMPDRTMPTDDELPMPPDVFEALVAGRVEILVADYRARHGASQP